jgi:small subunit ribosomal protein S20
MNKKQKNRKDVTQNKRNRMVNRRYSSTIKSLTKLIKSKLKVSTNDLNSENKLNLKNETQKVMNSLYSFIDKAVKKNVIHKNNAARKKSKLNKLIKDI